MRRLYISLAVFTAVFAITMAAGLNLTLPGTVAMCAAAVYSLVEMIRAIVRADI